MFKKIKNSDAQYYIAAGVIGATAISAVAMIASGFVADDED